MNFETFLVTYVSIYTLNGFSTIYHSTTSLVQPVFFILNNKLTKKMLQNSLLVYESSYK